MRVDLFDFSLPEDRIALRPATPRDAARMLVVTENGELLHKTVADLPGFLREGDALVINDTRVIAARLTAHRAARGTAEAPAKVELTLHKRIAPDRFLALARPAKRLRPEDDITFTSGLTATVRARDEGEVELVFPLLGPDLDGAIASAGDMPLPPYIAGKRRPDARDREDYQTIYASQSGAVAAPTAGLHFTAALFDRLSKAGVMLAHVTLHVGAGTFLPVTAGHTEEHRMHGEWANLDAASAERLNQVHASGGRIVAVGSTSLRTLESASDERGVLAPFTGETSLFITPGYRFKAVDVLMTNFHLPRSTLFMLVSAFSGLDVMKAAYAEAIARGYRFYSYGDACLLFRPQ